MKEKLGFNNQHAIAAVMSRRAFLKEQWGDAIDTVEGGEETDPKEFGQRPLALTSIGNGLLSAAPTLPSRHLNARKVQTNRRESGERQLG